MSTPLSEYALIGNCRSAALVSTHGSIDWLCLPRFDSPACFAALLGTPEHGRFLIEPEGDVTRRTRSYRGETLVLETVFETADGTVALIDFMAFAKDDEAPLQLVRIVEGRSGKVRLRMELVLRFDYGSAVPWVTREASNISAIAGPDAVRLYTNIQVTGEDMKTVATFDVAAGESVSFCLTHTPSHLADTSRIDPARSLDETEANWLEWSARSQYDGVYREAVQRSLLTLKSLTYRPTGGIVAAPTTSLPERLGSERNWDYRFCWIRDATITIYALLVAGYTEEAIAWRNWLLRTVAGSPAQTQVLYGVAGERRIVELELPWLPGYAGSLPVRIGNAAHNQLQLDTFGELMGAMFQGRNAGLHDGNGWALEKKLLEHLEDVWQHPDSGIWEVRGPERHFTHSKVMAWVAFDRAVRSVEQLGLDGPLEHWRALRDTIHRDVCEHGFSQETGTFTQVYGGTELDASLLQLVLVGFLPVEDPRISATVAAIERELLVEETFLLRYRTRSELDGLPEGEGAFLACSFWLVSTRVMQCRVDEATALFERLLAIRNDVGLLAEEYDPHARILLGNFPQAFSHLALVDAAVSLSAPNEERQSHGVAPWRTRPSGGVSS
jgi:GH15 family glucan-1,4-alpha-glucosidase